MDPDGRGLAIGGGDQPSDGSCSEKLWATIRLGADVAKILCDDCCACCRGNNPGGEVSGAPGHNTAHSIRAGARTAASAPLAAANQ